MYTEINENELEITLTNISGDEECFNNFIDNALNEVEYPIDVRKGVHTFDKNGNLIEGTLDDGSEEIDRLIEQVRELEANIEDLNGQIDVLNTQIGTLTGENSELKEQKAELVAQVAALTNEKELLSARIAALEEEITKKSNVAPLVATSNGVYFPSMDGLYAYNIVNVAVPTVSDTLAKPLIEGTLSGLSRGNIATVRDRAFFSLYTLETVNLPVCSTVGVGAFEGCTSLRTVLLPSATKIGDYAFGHCSLLTEISLPSCNTLGAYAFYYDSALSQISLPNVTKLEDYTFASCSVLMSVYLMGNIYVNMDDSSKVFANTPMLYSDITGTFGSIYVPKSMSYYWQRRGWEAVSERIVFI